MLSIDNVKTFLKTDLSDDNITLLLTMTESYIRNYCLLNDDDVLSDGLSLAQLKLINHYLNITTGNISSETDGVYQATFLNNIPKDVTTILDKYVKIRIY